MLIDRLIWLGYCGGGGEEGAENKNAEGKEEKKRVNNTYIGKERDGKRRGIS
jgi:hypothetical protein